MRRSIFFMLVIFSGAGFWSITGWLLEAPASPEKLPAWYRYQEGDPLDPYSYSLTHFTPDCEGSGSLCAVFAPADKRDDSRPDAASLARISEQSDHFRKSIPGLVMLQPQSSLAASP
ncbi:MAG TPA: hypothetical protein VLC98_12715 [Phnomibacter sp.]|nr:hypothetical protein [Phnomibacter sp.]